MITEWMWVDVKSVHSNGKLVGKLKNIPWGKTNLKLGSRVILDKNLIAVVTKSAQVTFAIHLMKSRGFDMNQIGNVLSSRVYPILTQKFIDDNMVSKKQPKKSRSRKRSAEKPRKRTRSKKKPRKRTRTRSKKKPRKRTRTRSRR
jgi:hypothetical protein